MSTGVWVIGFSLIGAGLLIAAGVGARWLANRIDRRGERPPETPLYVEEVAPVTRRQGAHRADTAATFVADGGGRDDA